MRQGKKSFRQPFFPSPISAEGGKSHSPLPLPPSSSRNPIQGRLDWMEGEEGRPNAFSFAIGVSVVRKRSGEKRCQRRRRWEKVGDVSTKKESRRQKRWLGGVTFSLACFSFCFASVWGTCLLSHLHTIYTREGYQDAREESLSQNGMDQERKEVPYFKHFC